MKQIKNIIHLFLGLFIIFFITGCLSNNQNSFLLKEFGVNKKVYIKNDTVGYDTYENTQEISQTLKRGDEYHIIDLKGDFLQLSSLMNKDQDNTIWVDINDIETKKTYFLTLLVNASAPTITIKNNPYKSNMRLQEGIYKVQIKANNFLDKTLDIKIENDTNKKITLDFDMEIINKKIAKQKIQKELKYNIYFDKNSKLMWQDEIEVTKTKKPWIEKENYDAKNYNNTTGDTAINYCKNLTLANFKDWRLPSKDELKKLSSLKKHLKHFSSNWYWSSTTSQVNEGYAWGIFFDNSDGYTDFKNVSNFVRCVRDN